MRRSRTAAAFVHAVVGLLLVAVGLGYFFFGVANFSFVERFPEDVDVLIEGVTAWIAAAALLWAALNHFSRKPWSAIVLLGGAAFTAGMMVSVATGASTPSMLQVVLPVLLVGASALLVEKRSEHSTAEPR